MQWNVENRRYQERSCRFDTRDECYGCWLGCSFALSLFNPTRLPIHDFKHDKTNTFFGTVQFPQSTRHWQLHPKQQSPNSN